MRFPLYILFLLLVFNSSAQAIESNTIHNVDLYTIEDGLSQTTVNCVIHDSKGFIWIGTQDGINKFDGYKFTVFKNDPNDSLSISNNFINTVIEDNEGNMWIGTKKGLNKFDPYTKTFRRFVKSKDIHVGLQESAVFNLYQDKQGYIWIKTESYLSRYNPRSEKFRHYEHYNDVFNVTPESTTFSIYEDHKGQLWVGTKDGLNYFDRNLEIFKRYEYEPSDSKSLSNNLVRVIFEDSKNNLWIGTDYGLNKFIESTEEFERHYVQGEKELNNNVVNDILEDKDGDLWLATNTSIHKYSSNSKKFIHYDDFYFNNENLGAMPIHSLAQDRTGNIWAGTFLGLVKIQGNEHKFNLYNKDLKGNPLFSSNYVLSFFKDKDDLFVGTWGSGFYIFNQESFEITEYNTSNSRLSNDYVHVFFKDSQNKLWIGTQDGISIFNGQTNRVEAYPHKSLKELLKNNRVFDIIEESENNFWIATKYGLHHLINDSIVSYYSVLNDSTTISSNHIYDIHLDINRMLWIGTSNGLNTLNLETEEVNQYIRIEGKCQNCISNNDVVYILEDTTNNCMWFGTMSGLNKLDLASGKFTSYMEKDGLPNNIIYAVLQCEKGNLWFSTNKGISKFDITKNEFNNFGVIDGLQDYEFNHGAAFKTYDGEMFFGGINGFNSFYPDSIVKNSLPPNIEITSIEILSEDGMEEINLGRDRNVRILHKDNLLTIEFAALDYTNPSKNKYAYKLDGLEDEWINIGNRRFATFTNIPAGSYTFIVKGSNSDGVWNDEGASINITVVTPFWMTTFAYVVYILIVVGMVFWFFQYRTRSLRRSNQELKEKQLIALQVAEQKEELTIKNKNITDSIVYAKRIQEALMPSFKLFKSILPNSFILHKAKDIVSGDFYWINEKGDKIFIAVVDCTGHGVPGAFMSIIGFELLRNITDDQGIEDADEILKVLNKGVATTFGQAGENVKLKDGMDIALCVIDKKKKEMEFAGAFRPLYFIRDNKIQEIKGDRFSVGLLEDGEGSEIHKSVIPLKKDDVFYIFSDGYADQFGGSEGKKYKYRRYRHLLLTIHKLPLEQQKTYLDRSFEDWKGKHEQVDDVLIVGFKPEIE